MLFTELTANEEEILAGGTLVIVPIKIVKVKKTIGAGGGAGSGGSVGGDSGSAVGGPGVGSINL